MKLWILKLTYEPSYYDVQMAVVVRALSPSAARKIAAATAGYEGANKWLCAALTTCRQLHESGTPCMVLQDFKAG